MKTINIQSIPNTTRIGIRDNELTKCKQGTIVIKLTSAEDNETSIYYTQVRQLLMHSNRVILLYNKYKGIKELGMLMCLYGAYDIYEYQDDYIDKEYINSVIKRKPTKNEVIKFVDKEMVGYAEISNTIQEIVSSIDDLDKLKGLIETHSEEISSYKGVLDYLRNLLHQANEEQKPTDDSLIAEYKGTIDLLKAKVDELTEQVAQDKDLEEQLKALQDILSETKQELTDTKQELTNTKQELTETKQELTDTKQELTDTKQELTDTKQELTDTKQELTDTKQELTDTKRDVTKLELKLQDTKECLTGTKEALKQAEQLDDSVPQLLAYQEINTQLIRCKVRSIIYFKEVTHIRYINSFINALMRSMEKIHKLNVKLLIYDNNNAFINAYKPISLIGSKDFIDNEDRVLKLDKFVMTEANQAILESVLQSKTDVVLIYDRLRQRNDLVTGNIVTKYYIINSSREYSLLEKEYKAKAGDVITRPNVLDGALELIGDASSTESGSTSQFAYYFNKMEGSSGRKVMDSILTRSNIKSIKPYS